MMSFLPVSQLLPHADSAILVDRVLESSADQVSAAARIEADHPYFVPGRGVPAWTGIEMMAQTIALHGGLSAREAGTGPRSGMLLGARRFRLAIEYFPEGAELVVEADRTFGGVGGVAACACRILQGDRVLAEATVTIMEGEL